MKTSRGKRASHGARRAVSLALVCMTAMATAGCAAFWVGAGAVAGAAGVAYVRGELRSNVHATPREVARATSAALGELGIVEISSTVSEGSARVRGRTVNDRRVTVKATSDVAGESRLSIRVGTFGDEALSRRIHEEIVNRLRTPAGAGRV